jgi:uncharacterized integral membrane protein
MGSGAHMHNAAWRGTVRSWQAISHAAAGGRKGFCMSDTNARTVPFTDPQDARTPQLIAALVPSALALLLILFSWDEVHLTVLLWDVDIALGWVLLLLFVLGALTGWLAPRVLSAPARSRVRVRAPGDS